MNESSKEYVRNADNACRSSEKMATLLLDTTFLCCPQTAKLEATGK